MIICNFGCGREARFQFKNGKWCCSDNCAKCPSVKDRNWRSKSIEERLKISKKVKESYKKLEVIEKIKNRKPRKLTKDELEKRNEKFRLTYNKNLEKNSKKLKSVWKNLEYRKNQLDILKKCCWENESRNKKISYKRKQYFKKNPNISICYSYNHSLPNKQEEKLINIFDNLNLEYKFVGDYSFWIDGKNPDFINDENKKVIELFGDWWHSEEFRKDGKSNEQHENDRIEHFEKNGYKCLIIWENELKDIIKITRKIIEFNNI